MRLGAVAQAWGRVPSADPVTRSPRPLRHVPGGVRWAEPGRAQDPANHLCGGGGSGLWRGWDQCLGPLAGGCQGVGGPPQSQKPSGRYLGVASGSSAGRKSAKCSGHKLRVSPILTPRAV